MTTAFKEKGFPENVEEFSKIAFKDSVLLDFFLLLFIILRTVHISSVLLTEELPSY